MMWHHMQKLEVWRTRRKTAFKKKLYIFHHIPITYTPQVFHPHIYFFSSKMGNMLYTVNLVGGSTHLKNISQNGIFPK